MAKEGAQRHHEGIDGPRFDGPGRQGDVGCFHRRRLLLGQLFGLQRRAHRAEEGLDVAAHDLREVVHKSLVSLEPQFLQAGLSYEVNLPADPVNVRVDAARIGQVMLNLAMNAIKFTPADGNVTVAVRPSKDQVRVENLLSELFQLQELK